MKRVWRLCFKILCAASVLFFSCGDLSNLEVPESVSVKLSDVKYNIPLGSGSCVIRERISAAELQKRFNENLSAGESEVKVYDYAPQGADNKSQPLQYLIKYPVQEVPLTISADGTDTVEFTSKIEIPNLNSKISNSLKIEEKTYPIVETGTETQIPENEGIKFSIKSPDFSTMKVYSGAFLINIKAPQNVSSDFSLLAKVVLCGENGEEIAKSSEQDIASGAALSLDISGKTLVPEMRLKLSGEMSGGNAGKVLSYEVSMESKDFRIEKITGLNMTAEEIGDLDNDSETPDGNAAFSSSFSFKGMSESLVSAKIKKGNLNIFGKISEDFSGVKTEVKNISVRQPNGFSLEDSDFSNENLSSGNYLFNKNASLDEKTIKPSEAQVQISGEISVSFSNATINFTNGNENLEIETGGKCTIEQIEKIEVNISALSGESAEISGSVDTGLNFSTLLEQNLGSAGFLIKNVEFSGIEGYVYALCPEISALKNLSYSSCTIQASYISNGSAQNKNLISSQKINLKTADFNLDALAENETLTIEDSSILNEENYSAKTDENSVCELFNEMPDSLSFSYELKGFTGASGDTVILEQEDIDSLKNVKSIELFILIQIPLEFTLNDKYDYPQSASKNDGLITILDARQLINEINDKETTAEDLFERKSADEWKDEDKRKYLDLIKSAKITYKTTNTTGLEISGNLVDSSSGIEKEISFENGAETVFELTGEEIQKIFDSYPFNPRIPARIKADGTKKTISRGGEFSMSGYFTVCADGEVSIWSKYEEN